MSRFSPEVECVLRLADWFPGRQVETGPWIRSLPDFPWHAAADEFLREFGGLRVAISGPGITCACEPFEVDPELAVGEEGRFEELSELFGCQFSPVGETGRGEFFLAIDQEGILYLLAAWALRLGPGDLAVERLVSGIAPERLDPPARDTR